MARPDARDGPRTVTHSGDRTVKNTAAERALDIRVMDGADNGPEPGIEFWSRICREVAADQRSAGYRAGYDRGFADGHTPPSLASDQDILGRAVRCMRVCMGLVGEERTAQLEYLMLTSRLLRKPVSGVVKGLSSTGKSFTTECVVELFPDEAKLVMTAMSERALIYLEDDLAHRTVVLYEAVALREGREKTDDNQTAYIVRSLLSEGQIRYPTVVRDGDGPPRTVWVVKKGPTNLLTTTTSISLHAENETRVLSLPSDDSEAQTARDRDEEPHLLRGQPDREG